MFLINRFIEFMLLFNGPIDVCLIYVPLLWVWRGKSALELPACFIGLHSKLALNLLRACLCPLSCLGCTTALLTDVRLFCSEREPDGESPEERLELCLPPLLHRLLPCPEKLELALGRRPNHGTSGSSMFCLELCIKTIRIYMTP